METSKKKNHAELLIKLGSQLDPAGKGLQTVLTSIVETVVHTLDADHVSIWKFKQKSQEIICLKIHHRYEVSKPAGPIDLMPAQAYMIALQTEQAIACSNVLTDKRLVDLPVSFWVDNKTKSCLHIPVRIMNQVVAILRMELRSEHAWEDDVTSFCIQIGHMLAQVFLANELHITRERTLAYRGISTDLIHRYELPTMLNDLVRRSVEVLNASSGELLLADPDRRMIFSVAGFNLSPEQTNRSMKYGENVAGRVVDTGQDLLIKDYLVWPGRTEVVLKNEPSTTIVAAPLRAHGEMLGVIQVNRFASDQAFNESDHDLLVGFANLACMAIEQSRLIEKNLRLSQFQESMKQIVETTTFASSAVDFLETVTDYITHALSAPLAVFSIEDVFTVRGFKEDSHEQIKEVFLKRGKRYNPITVVHDINTSDAGYRDLAEVMRSMNVHTYIIAPIPMNHDRVGFVCIASQVARTWTSDEKQIIDIAANQIGLAIEGIRFYQDSQSQIDIIKRMSSITSSLNRLVAMDDLIPLIGEGAVRLLHADGLAVLLREQDQVVNTSWVFGVSKPELLQAIDVDGKDLLKMFYAVHEPILVTNISKSVLPKQVKVFLMTAGFMSAKLAPIIYSGNVIGVIAGFYEKVVDWAARDRQMMVTYSNTVALAIQNAWSYEQLEKGYMDLAVSLAEAMDQRESQQKEVSMRVADWAQRTARLIGLPPREQDILRWAAQLIDIGKVVVPTELIRKRGPLTGEEKQKLHHYPLTSEKLVSPLNTYREMGSILRGIREHYDGTGYPDNRKGDDIPLVARILAVVDAYLSMMDDRPYRAARTHEAAIEEIRKNSGKQFDPLVVDKFLQAVNIQPQYLN